MKACVFTVGFAPTNRVQIIRIDPNALTCETTAKPLAVNEDLKKMNWIDRTDYLLTNGQRARRGDRSRQWTFVQGDFRIQISLNHPKFEGVWVLDCPPWFTSTPLSGAVTSDDAKTAATKLISLKLQDWLASACDAMPKDVTAVKTNGHANGKANGAHANGHAALEAAPIVIRKAPRKRTGASTHAVGAVA